MSSIFLSYCSEDRALARKLVAVLERQGWHVWWDELLEGGDRFSAAIEAELDRADVVVVLWSKASVSSHWVQDEAARGRDSGRLVPVSIQGALPPLGFGQVQAINLTRWKGAIDAPVITDLSNAIARKAGEPQRALPVRKVSGFGRRTVLIGSAAAAASAVGAGAAWMLWQTSSSEAASSIAVLPFRNLSGDPAQDYFSAGIAEEVRNTLARNPLLKVIATTTSNSLRDRTDNLPDIAHKLGVAFLLDGSVRRSGESVRIAVQLIDALSGATRWTENFDRPFKKILEAQIEIATTVLRLLNIQMSGAGIIGDLRRTGGTDDPAAFDKFLQGRAEFERFNPEGFRVGAKLFGQASALDPRYAAAYSGQARCLANLATEPEGDIDFRKTMDKAVRLARQAHGLAPESAFVNIALGATLANDLQLREARQHYEAANRLSPRHLDVPTLYGLYQAYLGRFELASQALERAVSVDPLHPRVRLAQIWLHYWSGEYSEALAVLERILNEHPGFASVETRSYFEFVCNLELGRLDVAKRAAALIGERWEREWELAMVALRGGNKAPALVWLGQVEGSAANNANVANNRIALLTQLGRQDEALTQLEAEYDRRNSYLIRIAIDPLLRPLAGQARFTALARRIGLTG